MRHRLALVGIIAAAALGAGCFDIGNSVAGPSAAVNVNVQQQGGGAASPAPSPSPSPTAGASSAVRVEVHFFGIECNGVMQPPNTDTKTVKQGCVALLTASPFDASGTDVGKPEDFVAWDVESGGVVAQGQEANHYNRGFYASAVGDFKVKATLANGVFGELAGSVTQ